MCCTAKVLGWISGLLDKVDDELEDVACRVIGTVAKGENLLLDDYYPVLELVLAVLQAGTHFGAVALHPRALGPRGCRSL
mmetsp:Transcript_24046/g.74721  ORF Transcript_24046/g.74721 Transcript_24046/m.74721 type:complete len:80 (-) Transcript_24046:83-322(-)